MLQYLITSSSGMTGTIHLLMKGLSSFHGVPDAAINPKGIGLFLLKSIFRGIVFNMSYSLYSFEVESYVMAFIWL